MSKELWIKYGWAISMVIWVSIGALLIPLAASAPKTGALFFVAYTAFSAAGFFGFMLGMRSIKSDGTDGKTTNLQQIADWLTKLLLGAGLVELQNIGKGLWKLSLSMGAVIDGSMGAFIVLTITLGFLALGTLTGYLWSQLHYGNG